MYSLLVFTIVDWSTIVDRTREYLFFFLIILILLIQIQHYRVFPHLPLIHIYISLLLQQNPGSQCQSDSYAVSHNIQKSNYYTNYITSNYLLKVKISLQFFFYLELSGRVLFSNSSQINCLLGDYDLNGVVKDE